MASAMERSTVRSGGHIDTHQAGQWSLLNVRSQHLLWIRHRPPAVVVEQAS